LHWAYAGVGLSDAVERYLEERKPPQIKAKTVQTEKERGRIVKARLGDLLLRKITSEVVNGYMRERAREGMANGSVNRELDIIRGVLKRAKLWGPMSDDVKSLRPGDEVGRALTHDEKVRLEKIAKERPEWQSARLAMTLAVNTTMRASEIRNLRWRDINFFEKEVTVQRSKTKAGERTIPLNKDALGAILELRERAKLVFGDALQPNWYLFWRYADLKTPDPLRPTTSWRSGWRNLSRSIWCPACGQLQKPAERCW
jgi:integrase